MEYTVQRLLVRLDRVRKSGGGYQAICPSHDDKNPSLSVRAGKGGDALIFCHAGCQTEEVMESVGLKLSDLFA